MTLAERLKTSSFKSKAQEAVVGIMYLNKVIESSMLAVFKPYDISGQQYNVLRILRGKHPQAVNLFEVQERMISPMSNATRLVEKLRLKGYVERSECEQNRRKVDIKITESGLNLLNELNDKVIQKEQELLNQLTPEQLNTFVELINQSIQE